MCPYCKVAMTVRGGKERESHFSHPPNLSCAESTRVEGNYSKYKKQIKNDSPRRQLLVSMIRDELEISAKIHDTIQVLDG
ncbi:competence protein CoiA [Chryseomicrobium palamuruense]